MDNSAGIFAMIVVYRIMILLVGLAMSFMGYRLFLADKVNPAGDLVAKGGKYGLSLKGGAPGVFFCLLGTVLICFSIYKGIDYDATEAVPRKDAPALAPAAVTKVIPDKPPI
jgi:uncharacterized YccA/Bax inhibitor family protein